MKAFLMFSNRDFEPDQTSPDNEEALVQDLDLETLFKAMSGGDDLLLAVARKGVLCGLRDVDEIRYRQENLRDSLANSDIVRMLYSLCLDAINGEKECRWSFLSDYPEAILRRSVEVLQMFTGMLNRLRNIETTYAANFSSVGFGRFFAMVHKELSDEYFEEIKGHLRQLKFRDGLLISAKLGGGNKGSNYALRKLAKRDINWLSRIFEANSKEYSFRLHPRDESGAKALAELNDRGLNLVANALAQSTEHILNFFKALRTELGFYIGCLNLHAKLEQSGSATSFPAPVTENRCELEFDGLIDPCLALNSSRPVVSNSMNAGHKSVLVITGANQGGKTTFLRSIGVAQVMMQCGMYVAAQSYSANVCSKLFTHYKREEDTTMKSGKFDEELSRMNEISKALRPGSMVLFNESFAATNDREGSEIAYQIVRALSDCGIKVAFVTHLYEFAHRLYSEQREEAIFFRAAREPNGERSFKVLEGEPLDTSYGEDLYRKVFEVGRSPG